MCITYTRPAQLSRVRSRLRPSARLSAVNTKHTYNDVLPSANLKIDVAPDLVARFAAAETMTRADYSALGGFTSLSPPGAAAIPPEPQPHGGGSTGNPDLKPIRSTNLDAGLEWYFAKHSLLSATAFYMDLRNYVSYGTITKNYLTYSTVFPNGTVVPYDLTVAHQCQGPGRRRGIRLSAGIHGELRLHRQLHLCRRQADLGSAAGRRRPAGGNLEEHLQRQRLLREQDFSARVDYTYRSSFYSGLDRSTAFTQYNIGTLSASLGYTMNEHFSITLMVRILTIRPSSTTP